MKNISFAMTIPQIRNRTKDVTRRRGWSNLKPGERFWAVEKSMGLKKGEKIKKICLLECVRNEPEDLLDLVLLSQTRHDSKISEIEREGFPGMNPCDFFTMFCKANYGRYYLTNGEMQEAKVNRIEFRYVDEVET